MKIVQIAATGDTLYALCDNGSAWKYAPSTFASNGWRWMQLPGIPEAR